MTLLIEALVFVGWVCMTFLVVVISIILVGWAAALIVIDWIWMRRNRKRLKAEWNMERKS